MDRRAKCRAEATSKDKGKYTGTFEDVILLHFLLILGWEIILVLYMVARMLRAS